MLVSQLVNALITFSHTHKMFSIYGSFRSKYRKEYCKSNHFYIDVVILEKMTPILTCSHFCLLPRHLGRVSLANSLHHIFAVTRESNTRVSSAENWPIHVHVFSHILSPMFITFFTKMDSMFTAIYLLEFFTSLFQLFQSALKLLFSSIKASI